jgi:serine/threonine protein kinase
MDPAALVGETLDQRYRVEDVLGEGGMGIVVRAHHLALDQPVAIKLMRSDAEPTWPRRFIREARASARIDSEHVVRVFDVGCLDDGTPFLVMELLEGRDLEAVVADGQLAIEDAVRYGLHVCDALRAAHALGIVHRDVKPANLFLTRRADGSPCIKLLDFGISKEPEQLASEQLAPRSLTGVHAVLGSPQFMSPEQLASSRDVDPRADLWSLGATLFELLTLEHAFPGESLAELCTAIMRDAPRRLRDYRPEAPPELEDALVRCLTKDPDERVGSAEELAALLAQVLAPSERPPASDAPPARTSAPPSERPRRTSEAPSVYVCEAPESEPPPAPRPRPPTMVMDFDEDSWFEDEVTPAATVRPVTKPTEEPRRRPWSVAGALAAGLVLGGLTAAWRFVTPPSLLTMPSPAQALAVIYEDPAPAPAVAGATQEPSRFTDSVPLGEELRARLEDGLGKASEALAAGRTAEARRHAKDVITELGRIGVRPSSVVSSVGARAELVLGRVEGAAVLAALAKVDDVLAAQQRIAEVRHLLSRASAAYDRVGNWGVRSFFRCALVDTAALDLAAGQTYLERIERARTPGERAWLVKAAVAFFRDARVVYRHAHDVPAETTLCLGEAKQGHAEAKHQLAALAQSYPELAGDAPPKKSSAPTKVMPMRSAKVRSAGGRPTKRH